MDQAPGAPGELGDAAGAQRGEVVDLDADEPRSKAGQLQAEQEAGGGATAAERDDHVGGLGDLPGGDLAAKLETGLDVSDASQRHRPPGQDQVGGPQARPGAGQEERPGQGEGAELAAGEAQLGATGPHPPELGADVLVLGLGDEDEDRPHPCLARVERGRKTVVGADRPSGDHGLPPPAPRIAQQPLELSRLVTSVAAVAAVVLDPDRGAAPRRGSGQEPDRGRGRAERQPRQVEIERGGDGSDGLSYLTGTPRGCSVDLCEQTPIMHSPETYVYSATRHA